MSSGEGGDGAAVLTSAKEGVLVITLNRPQVKNAIDSTLSRGVLAALRRLDTDSSLRVGVLSGAGGTFCAGMDLHAFAREGLPDGIDTVFRKGSSKPLIAAVDGVALGGGLEMALIADLIVAAEDARFGSPEVRFGLFPAGGALLRLPQLLPRSVAVEMAMTGKPIGAREAFDHGLVVRLCEPGATLPAAMELARVIAANAPLGVAAVKRLLALVPGRTAEDIWAEQVALVQSVFSSQDAAEGAKAFAEKRAPQWRGT